MTKNATAEHVAAVLKALGDSSLLDTVLPIEWGNPRGASVLLGDIDYALSSPDKEFAQAVADYINDN